VSDVRVIVRATSVGLAKAYRAEEEVARRFAAAMLEVHDFLVQVDAGPVDGLGPVPGERMWRADLGMSPAAEGTAGDSATPPVTPLNVLEDK
jgi:hypothetical protein